LDGTKLGWANSFIKLSRHEIKFGIDSILDTAATPQRLKQWGVKDYRFGKHECFARKRREPLDTFWDIATWPWEKPKVHSIESHGGMRKFYKPQGRMRWNIRNLSNRKCITDGRPRQESARLPADTTKFLFNDIVLINESTKDIIIGELTCPMEASMTYRHETKTKKYYDLANRIAEKGCRGLVGKSLRKFLTALKLPKKIIKETLTEALHI
jgi:hypothetical protein